MHNVCVMLSITFLTWHLILGRTFIWIKWETEHVWSCACISCWRLFKKIVGFISLFPERILLRYTGTSFVQFFWQNLLLYQQYNSVLHTCVLQVTGTLFCGACPDTITALKGYALKWMPGLIIRHSSENGRKPRHTYGGQRHKIFCVVGDNYNTWSPCDELYQSLEFSYDT